MSKTVSYSTRHTRLQRRYHHGRVARDSCHPTPNFSLSENSVWDAKSSAHVLISSQNATIILHPCCALSVLPWRSTGAVFIVANQYENSKWKYLILVKTNFAVGNLLQQCAEKLQLLTLNFLTHDTGKYTKFVSKAAAVLEETYCGSYDPWVRSYNDPWHHLAMWSRPHSIVSRYRIIRHIVTWSMTPICGGVETASSS